MQAAYGVTSSIAASSTALEVLLSWVTMAQELNLLTVCN